MRKQRRILIPFLAIVAVIAYFSLSIWRHSDDFSEVITPPNWTRHSSVEGISLALPAEQYLPHDAVTYANSEVTISSQFFAPKSNAIPTVTVLVISPSSLWESYVLKVADISSSGSIYSLLRNYQITTTENYDKQGLKLIWSNAMTLLQSEKNYSNPVVYVGENKVLLQEATIINGAPPLVQFQHQQYCWVENGKLYLVMVDYPEAHREEAHKVVQGIILSFKIGQ